MSDRTSRIKSIIKFRCPHCHGSSLFINSSLYTCHKLGDTKAQCEICHTKLKPEPGFYFGAAYVNWMITIALWIAVVLILKLMNSLGWTEYGFLSHPLKLICTGTVVTILLFPYLFRLGRSVWAHLFIE